MVNGKQMTMLFHADDMKVSHHDYQDFAIFIEWLKQKHELEGLKK